MRPLDIIFRDNVVTITKPRLRGGRIVGVSFAARCELCGETSGGDWTAAGMAASWSASHRGLDGHAPLDEVCLALRPLVEALREIETAVA
jgi:hypothetical protein